MRRAAKVLHSGKVMSAAPSPAARAASSRFCTEGYIEPYMLEAAIGGQKFSFRPKELPQAVYGTYQQRRQAAQMLLNRTGKTLAAN